MKRRALLGSVGTAATVLAGCASSGDEIPYARCTEPIVPISELPSEARSEVDDALEEGRYETRDRLVYPELVGNESLLWDEEPNRYYEHRVDDSLLTDALAFEPVIPARESPGELKVSNQTDRSLEVTATVAAGDETTVVDDSLSVEPATGVEEVDSISPGANPGDREDAEVLPGLEFAEELRNYELSIAIADDRSTTETVAVGPWFLYYWIQITDDDLLLGTVRERDAFFHEYEGDSKAGVHAACRQPPSGWPERATGSNWD